MAPTQKPISRGYAKKLAARIREAERALADSATLDADALANLIAEAKAARIHVALGHKAFEAYRRETWREFVEELAPERKSNRAIAIAAGSTEGIGKPNPRGPRYLRALGRDVDVANVEVSYDSGL